MENNENITMSRFAFERMQAKEERDNRNKWIAIFILIALLAITNLAWLYFWNQYEYVDDYSIEAEQDGSGVNIVGGGDVDYGAESKDNKVTQDGTP